MKSKNFIRVCVGMAFACAPTLTYAQNGPMQYPETRAEAQTDMYFGKKVADPYRWLEDDRSSETAEWVKTQNGLTYGYLEQIPYRKQLYNRLEQLSNYERYTAPIKAGNYFFYYKNDGLQNQSVLYRTTGLDGKPEVFIDPNKISSAGTTTVNLLDFSRDDKFAAFSVSKAGSDWSDIVVYNVVTMQPTGDTLNWCKFSGASWADGGFYYSRYAAPTGSSLSQKNENQKVYFHKMGQPQSADELVFEDSSHPLRYYAAYVTEDEQYLVLQLSEGTSGNEVRVKSLRTGQKEFVTICKGYDADYDVIGTDGQKVLIRTNKGAPNFRVVAIDPSLPQIKNWKPVLGEQKDLLDNAVTVGGNLYATYLRDVSHKLIAYSKQGVFKKEISLPGLGTMSGISGKDKDKVGFFSFTNFISPATIYKVDLNSNTFAVYRKPNVKANLDQFEVSQVKYPSKDGTLVPMFIVHKKGLEKNGKNPTLLYGYGGFNISILPAFSAGWLAMLEQGGVLAYANIRGGGEYGEKWHKAGMLLKKQNVFDDFIAAAQYLQKEKYADAAHTAILGGSNGGLLVGACMTQRPDLFAVAFPAVGVLDMMRYHKFTVGWGWAVEYGSSDSAKYAPYLLKYSPLHNLKVGTKYPATMILTGDHDDRVVPAHSFKYAASLQKAQAPGGPPCLIRIDTDAGHGAGKPIKKGLEERADELAFMFYSMGVKELADIK
jgi:prolyl oligopeptidase